MWLESKRQITLQVLDTSQHVIHHRVDIMASSDDGERIVVGRILADELRRFDLEEQGEDVADVADSDSGGLEEAYGSLLDEKGRFRQYDFEGTADPVVYVYRFFMHPDFRDWKLPAMHAFCKSFDNGAIILAQAHTTAFFTADDFQRLGFRLNGLAIFPEPEPIDEEFDDRPVRFMLRENMLGSEFGFDDYPDEAPPATAEHQQWLEEQGPWEGLC